MGQFYDEEKIKAMEDAAAASASASATSPEAAAAGKSGAGPSPGRFYDEDKVKAMEQSGAPPQARMQGLVRMALIALLVIAGLGLLWWKLAHNPDTMIVNVNKATATELSYLPGVGPVTARKIIEGRPYHTVEELKRVSGIGQKTYEKMKARVKVD